MKFREHRGDYDDSMATTVHVADRDELLVHLRGLLEKWPSAPSVNEETVSVVPYYGSDPRNGWANVHLVVLKDYGVMGYTDSPC